MKQSFVCVIWIWGEGVSGQGVRAVTVPSVTSFRTELHKNIYTVKVSFYIMKGNEYFESL